MVHVHNVKYMAPIIHFMLCAATQLVFSCVFDDDVQRNEFLFKAKYEKGRYKII